MTKFTTKTKILALALTTCSVLALGSAAEAETITSTATVNVLNAIGFTETKALTFGTIVAQTDGTGAGAAATILVANGADNDTTVTNVGGATDDRIVELIQGDRAQYDISGAAPSTALNVTIPTAPLQLVCGACVTTPPEFTVDIWTDDSTAGVLTTDGAGAGTLNVGATLSTDPVSLVPYEDGLYSGNYDVSVNY